MATYNYYHFNQGSYYAGTYDVPVNDENAWINGTAGTVCQPGSILKFSPGNIYGTDEIINFALDYTMSIESLTVSDWDLNMKNEWFQAYMTKVGLKRFITEPVYDILFNQWESDFGFEQLSGLSLAYVYQEPVSLEVRLGINVYANTFFQDWIFANANDPNLGVVAADLYGTLKPGTHYISNVGKITYGGHTDIVYSFGIPNVFTEYVLTGGESLATGGGNLFKEIKLAGAIFKDNESVVQAHYIVVKNVPEDDPTKGYCTALRAKNESGFNTAVTAYLGPFCVGDVLTVINDSIYTTRTNLTNTFTWTWFGDLSDIPTTWYLADITNPCTDYRTVPIFDMLFPLRVVSECKYEDFD